MSRQLVYKGEAVKTQPNAVTQYKRDGYYIARQLLPASELEHLLVDVHHLAIQQLKQHGLPYSPQHSMNAVHDDLKTLFNHDVKIYLATLTLAAKLTSFYELFLHPNLRGFIATLGLSVPMWQTGPVFHLMSSALRIPDGYYGFGMHQDWPSLQAGLDGVIVWIPLVDVDRHMLTMEIIPRSHTHGIYPSTGYDNVLNVEPTSYNEEDIIPIEAHCGDVVFMSTFTLHRSKSEGDDRLRISVSTRYENAAEPYFIERGYPLAQKRAALKELITPDFPTAEQLQKVFES